MRRLFTIALSILMLSSGMAMAAPASDNNDGQKTEQKTEKKDEKKEEKKDDCDGEKGKPRKPILIVVYEFAWPWIMR
jgi:hypothetical protein